MRLGDWGDFCWVDLEVPSSGDAHWRPNTPATFSTRHHGSLDDLLITLKGSEFLCGWPKPKSPARLLLNWLGLGTPTAWGLKLSTPYRDRWDSDYSLRRLTDRHPAAPLAADAGMLVCAALNSELKLAIKEVEDAIKKPRRSLDPIPLIEPDKDGNLWPNLKGANLPEVLYGLQDRIKALEDKS